MSSKQNIDFNAKRFDNHSISSFEIGWNRGVLSDQDIDKSTAYYITFILDNSGSMSDGISTDQENTMTPNFRSPTRRLRSPYQSPFHQYPSISGVCKYKLVASTVKKCIFLISEMNKSGMNINVSIIMFNSNAECVYPFTKVNSIEYNKIKSKIKEWCEPEGGTQMEKAFTLAKENIKKQKQINSEAKFHTVLLSDGYNNGEKDEVLIEKYGDILNTAIGIGNIEDYNHKLFCELAQEDNTYCANNESKLKDYFLQTVFGSTTVVANKIKVRINSLDVVTPHEVREEKESNVIELEDFHSHRKIFFLAPKTSNITVCYTNNSKENKCLILKPEEKEDSEISELIKFYCKATNKLREINNEKDIKKQQDRIIDFHKELTNFKVKESDEGIYGNINSLLKNVKDLATTREVKAYLSCMRYATKSCCSGNYANLQRHVSATVGNRRLSANHTEMCVICLSNDKKTIFKPCGHLSSCRDCAIKLVNSKKECPICKVKVEKVYEINNIDKDFLCVVCNKARVSTLNKPCNHANMCNGCAIQHLQNNKDCPDCKQKLKRTIPFKSV